MIQRVRKRAPLVHCITNYVAAPFQANGLLALGASPIMADALEEVEDVAQLANSLSLNIGTLRPSTVKAMQRAGKVANRYNVPIILDPVGAGATPYRLECAKQLLDTLRIDVIRGNAGEIAALLDVNWQAKGVDAGEGSISLATLAQQAAKRFHVVVAISGEIDYVSDGTRVVAIEGGHALMERITGMGCLLSSVVASFVAVERDSFQATIDALQLYKKAGERAATYTTFPGQFQQHFLDALYYIQNGEDIK